MAITEQEAAKSSHTHLVMVILVVCFALCVSLLFVALRFWCRCIIGFSYWDDAAVMALLCIVGMGSCILTLVPLGLNDPTGTLPENKTTPFYKVQLHPCLSEVHLTCAPLEAVWNRNLRMKCVTSRLELAYLATTGYLEAQPPSIPEDRSFSRLWTRMLFNRACYRTDKMGGNLVIYYMGYRQAAALGFGRGHFSTGLRVYPYFQTAQEKDSHLSLTFTKSDDFLFGYRIMSSLCNYSHPELQITDGLIRQDTGRLFPYNPEFYSNATGLYGPGTIYCWYMLLVSVLASWAFCLADEDGPKKPGLSNDLLGALAYPVFAATDLAVQSMKMLGMEKRALAIFCLRNPEVNLDLFGPFNTTQLDLNHIPPDTVILGQRVVDITGPLTICYSATPFLLILIIGFMIDTDYARNWKPKPSARWVVNVAYGYISLMLTIFHFSLGDIGTSFFIALYEAMLPVMLTVIYLFTAFIGLTFLTGIIMLVWSTIEKNYKDTVEALKALGGCIFFAGMLVVPSMLMIHRDRSTTIPDLGIRVSERDQLATLLVGIVTLTFTVIDVFRNFYRERHRDEVADAEMQMLPAAEGATGHS
ncbi:hypothetical protein CEK25_012053 [Fusarium fujikuroi]|nr:hypothetical protein CEK25_012053 [Fusarium fujikuroi]